MKDAIRIEIVRGDGRDLVPELVALQRQAFPPRMQFRDPEQYYVEGFADPVNVNVILRASDGLIVGHLLALPQDRVCAELRRWDTQMRGDPRNLYIDIIQTLPQRRQGSGLRSLLAGLCREAPRRGASRISAHVRTATGLSRVVQRVMEDCRCLRRLDNWYDSGESFDFLDSSIRLQNWES